MASQWPPSSRSLIRPALQASLALLVASTAATGGGVCRQPRPGRQGTGSDGGGSALQPSRKSSTSSTPCTATPPPKSNAKHAAAVANRGRLERRSGQGAYWGDKYEGMSGLVDSVVRGTGTRPKTAFTAWTEGVAPDETPPAFYSEIYLCDSATASSLSDCATESAGCDWTRQYTVFQDDGGNVFVLCVNGGKVVGEHAAGGGARLRDGCRRWTLSARRFGGGEPQGGVQQERKEVVKAAVLDDEDAADTV
ncbi:hypothetical protein DFJ73DRAFT_780707 [Zopfochytrium polystomum]|nr:hypothetical protein DFJ73DRAFT_780707 [Zopfochytrium polystomum]